MKDEREVDEEAVDAKDAHALWLQHPTTQRFYDAVARKAKQWNSEVVLGGASVEEPRLRYLLGRIQAAQVILTALKTDNPFKALGVLTKGDRDE